MTVKFSLKKAIVLVTMRMFMQITLYALHQIIIQFRQYISVRLIWLFFLKLVMIRGYQRVVKSIDILHIYDKASMCLEKHFSQSVFVYISSLKILSCLCDCVRMQRFTFLFKSRLLPHPLCRLLFLLKPLRLSPPLFIRPLPDNTDHREHRHNVIENAKRGNQIRYDRTDTRHDEQKYNQRRDYSYKLLRCEL